MKDKTPDRRAAKKAARQAMTLKRDIARALRATEGLPRTREVVMRGWVGSDEMLDVQRRRVVRSRRR